MNNYLQHSHSKCHPNSVKFLELSRIASVNAQRDENADEKVHQKLIIHNSVNKPAAMGTRLTDQMPSEFQYYGQWSDAHRRMHILFDVYCQANTPKTKPETETGIAEDFVDQFHRLAPDKRIFGTIQSHQMPAIVVHNLASNTPVKPEPKTKSSATQEFLENLYRFVLGGGSGIIGASSVYPMDVVKTRMQNQKRLPDGTLMYKNTFSAFGTIVRSEGFLGLYRGLPPLLFGVTPEKATKLAVNDFVRGLLTNSKGELPIPLEIVSGGCAGFCQVLFTNPLEIVKIQMQMAGESGDRLKAGNIIRELGFRQLYRGSRACWLRDIPFTGIYFPSYAHLKVAFADSKGYNSPLSMFGAACLAGVPASSLVTPADVIKTRLQARGQTEYTGVLQTTRKIMLEEGFGAFWKGAFARCCRSAPQFGVTILVYEVLQRVFPFP